MDCLGECAGGATHDYFSGMLSIRHGGESLPEIIGRYLGMTTKQVMRGFYSNPDGVGGSGFRCRGLPVCWLS